MKGKGIKKASDAQIVLCDLQSSRSSVLNVYTILGYASKCNLLHQFSLACNAGTTQWKIFVPDSYCRATQVLHIAVIAESWKSIQENKNVPLVA